eukprot:4331574-Prymnesium_polylepis.1
MVLGGRALVGKVSTLWRSGRAEAPWPRMGFELRCEKRNSSKNKDTTIHGGGTGGPGPHNVRLAKCAKKGYLNYGQ